MPMSIYTSGGWKEVSQPTVYTSGGWKKVTNAWVYTSGGWKQFYVSIQASLPTPIDSFGGYPASANVVLSNAGTWSAEGFGSGTWLEGGANTDFECRASSLSGDTPSGTFNSWLPLSSTRSWVLSTTQFGPLKNCSFTLEIRLAAVPNTVLATSSVSLTAESQA